VRKIGSGLSAVGSGFGLPASAKLQPQANLGGSHSATAPGATPPTADCPLPTADPARSAEIWCQTFTGRAFPLLRPAAADIDWRDIAASLSKQCRYNGHCQAFYSVAQHSVLAAEFAASKKLWDADDARVFAMAIEAVGHDRLFRAVLLHDAPESFIGDLTTPMKQAMTAAPGHFGTKALTVMGPPGTTGIAAFDAIEDGIAGAVSARADLDWPLVPAVEAAVKRADLKMLATELRDLMAEPPRPWRIPLPAIPCPAIKPLLPGPAEAQFLRALEAVGLDPRA
jgi:hypothetical protein